MKGIDAVKKELPELPAVRAQRFRDELDLSAYDADKLTATRELADYFEQVISAGPPAKEVANWVLGEVSRLLNEGTVAVHDLEPAGLAALIARKLDGTISNNQAKDIFARLAQQNALTAAEIEKLIQAEGMRQVTDRVQLEAWVEAAIVAQSQAVADFRAGKESALGRLVGEVMKASQGKASGPAVNAMLRERLSRPD